MKSHRTSSRKKEHVALVLSADVGFQAKTTGFDRWDFVHNALPELDIDEIDTTTTFLGKELGMPFIVSSMTGGYREATRINRQLAEVCAEKKLAMGVGSQRQALENASFRQSFSVVREVSREIPILGNIGAAEVARFSDASPLLKLIDLIKADGFIVHLNPLQEYLQPEGTPRFRGVLKGIEMLVRELPVPVVVKEIGAGISAAVARRLLEAGVQIIDVAGAGGTSWAGVEMLRRKTGNRRRKQGARLQPASHEFWDWGIPTTDALRQVVNLKQQFTDLTVISSGGLRNGIDIAKSIAFGADLAGVARPLLQNLRKHGVTGLRKLIDVWEHELRGVQFLTGARTIADLQNQQLILR